jgi:prevent-host-death family protein
MREVSIFDAKNKLSALVSDAEAGETIAITRRGIVVAHLTPAKPREDDSLPRLLAQLSANRDARAATDPASAKPIPWETLKAEMEAEDDAKIASWSRKP